MADVFFTYTGCGANLSTLKKPEARTGDSGEQRLVSAR